MDDALADLSHFLVSQGMVGGLVSDVISQALKTGASLIAAVYIEQADPNYQLSVFASDQCGGWSDGCFADPEFDALYEAQQRELNVDERLKIVQDAQRRLYKQLPGLVLAYPGGVQAYRTDRFEGWVPAPGPNGYLVFGYGSWSYVNIRPVTEGGGTPTGAGTSGISPLVWIAIAVGVIIVLVLTLTRRGRDEA